METKATNPLRHRAGLAYAKAYNLHKDIFWTPLKGYTLFQNPSLDAIGFSQELIEKFYSKGVGKYAHKMTSKRANIVQVFEQSKQRANVALRSSRNTNFGVRQEVRITMASLRALELPPAISSPEDVTISSGTDAATHRPFYILHTAQVNAYFEMALNRWLLLVETLASQVQPEPGKSMPQVDNNRLIQNSLLIAFAMEIIRRITSGDDPTRYPSLWKDKVKRRVKRGRAVRRFSSYTNQRETSSESECSNYNDGRNTTGDSSGTENSDSDETDTEPNLQDQWEVVGLGLNLQFSITKTNQPSLCNDFMNWNTTIPSLSRFALQNLFMPRNGLQAGFATVRNIMPSITADEKQFLLVRENAQAAAQSADTVERDRKFGVVRRRALEFVVAKYIAEVWEMLYDRYKKGTKSKGTKSTGPVSKLQSADWPFQGILTKREATGFEGLTPEMVTRVIKMTQGPGVEIHYAYSRPHKSAIFKDHEVAFWDGKLAPLFTWDDNIAKRRAWHNAGYRRAAFAIHAILEQEGDSRVARHFRHNLRKYPRWFIWIAPNYDIDHFSIVSKAYPGHGQDTKERLGSMSLVERTSWIAPGVPAECIKDNRVISQYTNDTRQEEWPGLEKASIRLRYAMVEDRVACLEQTHAKYGALAIVHDPVRAGFTGSLDHGYQVVEESRTE